MNLERLEKLYTFLDTKVRTREERNPNLFWMNQWADGFFESPNMTCNTAACALGHATQCFPNDLELLPPTYFRKYIQVRHKRTNKKGLQAAESFFGISSRDAQYIFFPISYNSEQNESRIPLDMVLKHLREVIDGSAAGRCE